MARNILYTRVFVEILFFRLIVYFFVVIGLGDVFKYKSIHVMFLVLNVGLCLYVLLKRDSLREVTIITFSPCVCTCVCMRVCKCSC